MSNTISKARKSELVFNLTEQIREAQNKAVENFLIIGKNLDIIQSEKLWRYYGSHIENFGMFLKEVGLKHGTAWNCIRIWRTFGEYKPLYVDYFRLVKLLPVVDNKNKEDWIEKARNLTASDLDDEIRMAKGKKSQLDCRHPEKEREYYYRCKICNKWIKISKNGMEK